MSFAHAPVSKGWFGQRERVNFGLTLSLGMMIGFGISSLLAAIFDVRHYFHLQLVPHISRDHQVTPWDQLC
jgi:hypothetical protein